MHIYTYMQDLAGLKLQAAVDLLHQVGLPCGDNQGPVHLADPTHQAGASQVHVLVVLGP